MGQGLGNALQHEEMLHTYYLEVRVLVYKTRAKAGDVIGKGDGISK
jgi:hypothetical protein